MLTLPRLFLAEIFGVSIDDLFDVTTEQRLNRIENRMDAEEELPSKMFSSLRASCGPSWMIEASEAQAFELIAYLYWHRMNAEAQKASRYAKEAVAAHRMKRAANGSCVKQITMPVWDWNIL